MNGTSSSRSKLIVWFLVILLTIETAFFIRALYLIDMNTDMHVKQQAEIDQLQEQVDQLVVEINPKDTEIVRKRDTSI